MTPQLFIDNALAPALKLLPPKMDTPAARIITVAICFQESRLIHRKQIGGPARGYAQFEKGGGVVGVLTHRASAEHAKAVCEALDYEATAEVVYEALADNDILACVFARLLLWTHPKPIPTRQDAAWQYYLNLWRPGKPHPATWADFYEQARAMTEV